MPTKKIAATEKATVTKSVARKVAPVVKKAAAKSVPQPVAAATFRMKIDLANLAVGAKTLKQFARAVAKLAQTLSKMDGSGAVQLEQPVTAKGAHLATTDAEAAKRFGMEEGRATRASATPAPAKKAATKKTRTQATPVDEAPAAEAIDVTVTAKRAAQKAAGKKASRRTRPLTTRTSPRALQTERRGGGTSGAVGHGSKRLLLLFA